MDTIFACSARRRSSVYPTSADTSSCAMCLECNSCHLEIPEQQMSTRVKRVHVTTDSLQRQSGLMDFLHLSRTSSLRDGCSLFISPMLISLLILSIVPASTLAFNADRTTQSNQESSTAHTGRISCPRHFGHRVQSCVAPFTSLLDLYNANVDHMSQAVTIAKHICIEYQMVLLCLHSALSDCPTLKNLKRVQDTLDSQWVTRINGLCSIQSKSSSETKAVDNKDLRNYISNKNAENHMDSHQIAREILKASMKTRAELEQEIISGHTEESHASSVPDRKQLFPEATQKDLDFLSQINHQVPAAAGSNAKLELNIVNFIQNYNYAAAPQRSENARHSSIRLIHVDYNSSSLTSRNVYLIVLCCTILLVWLSQ
ncbi:uncharacterized protein LOC106069893 [Biomphalaria glabrata]|uniref:Uncharacterized protein LOC106069893 n=1 Tax=Biomphalaria glabrata TaxID=6526 RepID=A0A9U8EFF5_BIOGL|nr:uncharacterized protein LOC106069893 [Biomphalaria glabrata]